MPKVAAAIASGGAPPPLPWAPEGRPEFNRAVLLNLLARQWLPAITDVDLRLRRQPLKPTSVTRQHYVRSAVRAELRPADYELQFVAAKTELAAG